MARLNKGSSQDADHLCLSPSHGTDEGGHPWWAAQQESL